MIKVFGYFMQVLTESRATQSGAFLKGVAGYRPASALALLRTFAWLCWRRFTTAVLIVATLPLAVLLVLVSGIRCVACNRHIWPWQKSADERYSDNMDAIHEGCCPQLARDIN
jgi:hypothetical protein